MSDDFERDFAALLRSATPQPPVDLAAPTIATLTSARSVDFIQDSLIEFPPAEEERPARFRWLQVLAAACVVALAVGVLAAVAAVRSADTQGSGSSRTRGCPSGKLVVAMQNTKVVGEIGTTHLRTRNLSGRACSITLPRLWLSRSGTVTEFAPPAGSTRAIVLSANGYVTVELRVQVIRGCPAATWDAMILAGQDGERYSFRPDGLCATAPVNWTFVVSD